MQVIKNSIKREYFHPPKPTYQSNIISKDVVDYKTRKNDIQTSDCEIEFQTQHHIADHCLGSPPEWTRRASRGLKAGAFASFSLQHHHSLSSPTKRLQVITESRDSLMRMVEDMPESSYELSLRDIVDDQRSMEEVQQKAMKKSKSDLNTKRRSTKKGKISRSESMESGVFLLKIFVPAFLGSSRDSKEKTCPKVSPPKPSSKRAKNRNGLHRSTSDISWSKERPFTSYFRAASWSSNRKQRQRGCLF
ncbi:hypothetical protein Leryth_005463 [Lithospermum erythrorhizon]|nr:hypothetical protein Leryth_005463 [Lithospermum erythrorhizon]